jgi:carbonyl reductase 1
MEPVVDKSSNIRMRNKVAIVTGANQGIGYHIASQIARTGDFARVILACRRIDAGNRAACEIRTTLPNAHNCIVEAMELDVSNPTSISDFATAFVLAHGDRLDVLVNNAGMAYKGSDPTPFGMQSRRTIDTNYLGTVSTTEAMLPCLRRAGSNSRVVNVASRAGGLRILKSNDKVELFVHPADVDALTRTMYDYVNEAERVGENNGYANTNYGMSKCGVIAYTSLMSRLCPELTWSAMCPGYCNTSMTSGRGTKSACSGADTAVWLATTDDPSAYVSGGFYADRARLVW